jgi:ABC-type lipoprotein release transport system permease subunit
VGSLAIAWAAFIALVLFARELVVWLGLPTGFTANGAAILLVYLLDLIILLLIGRVPLYYNVRNLLVRWRITAMTALAFTVVVAILTVLLAFVNGMNQLSAASGHPANVIVLSDGSTDEVFSNLGFGDVAMFEREVAMFDQKDRPLDRPVRVKRIVQNGIEVPLVSRETYCIVNRPMESNPLRRQFVQVRGIVDPLLSSQVHELPLLAGRWFTEAGVQTPAGAAAGAADQIEAVIGTGLARTLGEAQQRPPLVVGDTFTLGDRTWVVVGIMNAEGTSFGSELWAKQAIVGKMFNKNNYTTDVLRIEDDGPRELVIQRAQIFAHHLGNRFNNPRVAAQTELDYYAKQSESNSVFLFGALAVAAVMAVGGIFGVMNTMFAAVAQRIKDIGVLRILGFKRWQVLVSFMLESLTIGAIGGLVGLALGSLCHGFTATSVLSSGQGGGGKTVILKMIVDGNVIMAGLLFTMIMGRLGGLIPALSAMRLKILESLR